MSIWIWSDCHWFHKNIIDYEQRPFNNIEQMNEALMCNWRNTVKPKDIIINLGDVGFGSKEMIKDIISIMPGKKLLVLGNHDRGRSLQWWYDVGFDEVYKYPIIYDKFYILSHEPLYVGKEMPYVNIHGHTHGTSTDNKQQLNVSVEKTNYMPINFDTIKNRFSKGD